MEKCLLQNRKIISEHCQQVLMVHHDHAEHLTLHYKKDERFSSSCTIARWSCNLITGNSLSLY